MRILLLADHNYRDVAPLAAVQVAIESISKHTVQIADIHLFQQVAEIFKPHLVVINHLHDKNRNRIVDEIRRRGGLCAVLPTEGRPNTLGQLEWAGKRFDTSLCDLYLSWSHEFVKYLDPKVKVEVTGCPRFSFYSKKYSREQIASFYGLDIERPIITVASSFPQAKFDGFAQEFLKNDWANLGVDKIPGREDPVKVAHDDRVALDKFMSWIAACIHEYPEYQFVIKPHPAEDTLPWQQFCDEHKATLMLTDYIWNLLAMSDLHLARVGCLTAVESWLTDNRSVQLLCGGDFLDGPSLEATEVGVVVADLRELLDELVWIGPAGGDVVDEDSLFAQPEYISKWLGDVNNGPERVAKALVALLNDRKPNTVFEYTNADRIALNQVLAEHSKQHSTPRPDHLGQFAKAVTQSGVRVWLEELRSK